MTVWVLDIVVTQWFCGIYYGRCLPLPQLPQHRRLSYALFFATGISSTTLTSLSVVFTPTRCYLSSVTFGVLVGAAIPAVLLVVNPNWPGDFTFPNSYLWFAAMSNSYRVIYSSVPISHSLAPSGVWYPSHHLFWCVCLEVLELAKHCCHSLSHSLKLFRWSMPNNPLPPPLILLFMLRNQKTS